MGSTLNEKISSSRWPLDPLILGWLLIKYYLIDPLTPSKKIFCWLLKSHTLYTSKRKSATMCGGKQNVFLSQYAVSRHAAEVFKDITNKSSLRFPFEGWRLVYRNVYIKYVPTDQPGESLALWVCSSLSRHVSMIFNNILRTVHGWNLWNINVWDIWWTRVWV